MNRPARVNAVALAMMTVMVASQPCFSELRPSDYSLTKSVERALKSDFRLRAFEIKVTTTGGKVTLSGIVPGYIEKDRAERLCERVDGVEAVRSELRVQLLPHSDDEIARSIRQRFRNDITLRDQELEVDVHRQIVTIKGEAEGDSQRRRAEQIAREIPGVTMDDVTAIGSLFAANDAEPALLAARLQMALTLGFHIILACFGVGLPILLLVAEGLSLRTGDPLWKILARRWSKAFAVLFAVGAVSGTVLSFELGLLWPAFMQRFGAVIGLPFTLEGFAFFLEAIFAGIYLYGWDKLSPRVHWLCGFPIAAAGVASAWFVVTANAWMNVPQGFRLDGKHVVDVDPIAAMLNPATAMQTTHMIVAAYMVTGFCVASYYALVLLRSEGHANLAYPRRALLLGLLLGTILTPVQIVVGDWAAKVVAKSLPVKLAAMEGQFRTERRAPLRIGGIPNERIRKTPLSLEIPGALSWLAYGNMDAEVRGLEEFPEENWPPVAVVHVAFQAMVLAGLSLLVLSLYTGSMMLARRRLPQTRAFLWAVTAAGPISVVALECGWIVTEVGRQPWIVQGVMRTEDAVTQSPGKPIS